MNCKYHNNLKGTNTCSACGEWICENCVLEVDGRIYCKDCLKSKLKNESSSDLYKGYTSEKHTGTKLYKSGFLTFMFGIIPGIAQMYLGYTKRGLIILSLFILCYYVDLFSPLILLIYAFSFFDSFKLKNNLERGIYQEDNITDIKKFMFENKFFIIILSLIVIIPAIFDFFDDIFDDIFDNISYVSEGICYSISRTFNLEDIGALCIGALLGIIICIIFVKLFKKDKKHIEKVVIKETDNDNTK